MVVRGKGGWQEERATEEQQRGRRRERERSREGEAISSWMVVVVVSKPHAAVAAA